MDVRKSVIGTVPGTWILHHGYLDTTTLCTAFVRLLCFWYLTLSGIRLSDMMRNMLLFFHARANVIHLLLLVSQSFDVHAYIVFPPWASLLNVQLEIVGARSARLLPQRRFPRNSCSLSIASKRDLKFPAPKPEKLFRWIISINTVGRSIRCCEEE